MGGGKAARFVGDVTGVGSQKVLPPLRRRRLPGLVSLLQPVQLQLGLPLLQVGGGGAGGGGGA